MRTKVLVLVNSVFQFKFGEESEEIAKKRRVNFLRNLRFLFLLEKGKAVVLQGQKREGESEEACWRIIDDKE